VNGSIAIPAASISASSWRLDERCRRHAPRFGGLDGGRVVGRVRLGAKDRDQGRRVDDHRGSPSGP
jgi:hypothetical protein